MLKGSNSPDSKSKESAPAAPALLPKSNRKPYEEIGAIFNGNEVKIRVPKSTSKPAKLTPSQMKLQQQCTCEDDESTCSDACGAGAGGNTNQLNFQVPDDICEALTNRTTLNSELVYTKREAHDTLCNICNVTPSDAPKGVNAQKVLHPDKDVFILKIGKQTDEPNRTGNIEKRATKKDSWRIYHQPKTPCATIFCERPIKKDMYWVELVTPRAPAKLKPPSHSCKLIQCEEEDIPCCGPCRTCRGPPRKKRPRRKCCS